MKEDKILTNLSLKTQGVGSLIEDQIQKWLTQQENKKEVLIKPMITVSREYGTGGAYLSKNIAEEISFNYWNQDILQEIANSTNMSEIIIMIIAGTVIHNANILAEELVTRSFGIKNLK